MLLGSILLALAWAALQGEVTLANLLGHSYRQYVTRVPRWLGIPAAPAVAASPLVAWSQVFRREKRLIPGMLAAALAIAALREQWIPTRVLTDLLERESRVELAYWIAGVFAAIVVGNAVKVELHQRQRRASRAAARHHGSLTR